MAEKKKLTVAEMLAMARKLDSGKKDAPAEPSEPVASEAPAAEAAEPVAAVSEEAPAAPKPAAAKPKPAPGGKLSVAEMLAAARAEKSGAAAKPAEAKKPAPVAKTAEKPAAKAPAAKAPAAEKVAAEKEKPAAPVTAVKDTASILAEARSGAKPGPMSKAEAATKQKTDPAAHAAKEKAKIVVPPMPVKPDYAKPKPPKDKAEGEDRRSFLNYLFGSFLAVGFTSMASTFGLWTLGMARFMFPNILTEPPSKFKVGFPSDFPPGSVEEKFKAQFGVWIVNTEVQGKREIFALRTVCTHLGCTPNWLEGEQKFKCPCHGSGFYKDGINFEGPAPRPLERYAIQLADDGQLEVDKSKLFQEELGQWDDPTSFVSV
jgi:cytochrome b6-f complex iron-sulfur subunit